MHCFGCRGKSNINPMELSTIMIDGIPIGMRE